MVTHLENWGYLRDMMCAFPDETRMLISDTLKEMKLPAVEKAIKMMVSDCSCAGTKEGFESCLVQHREDIADPFRGPGENSAFEAFLEKLDNTLKKEVKIFYEEHRL